VVRLACYSPLQLEKAYHLRALYAKGFTGTGRTIVIVDPFGSPTIRHDLKVFDHAFGLHGSPRFKVLQPVGRVPPYNPNDDDMVLKAGETTEDVEMAHSLAPGANILLVETPAPETDTGGGFPKMMAAENYVIRHNLGDVISQSFSLPEQNLGLPFIASLRYAYRNAYRHHVSVLAASNDLGVTGPNATGTAFYTHPVVNWPASDPLVTGVGGTKLHVDAAGRRTSPDTAWNDSHSLSVYRYTTIDPWASSGGVSKLFGRPAYQGAVRQIVGGHRGVPDLALTASISGGVLIYASYRLGSFRGSPGWIITGGTSGATPDFAAIVAIADQYAKRRLGLLNPALYRLERRHARGIVDVTKGNNTVSFPLPNGKPFTLKGYRAKPGYDLVTGAGTVNAGRLVPELASR
jgi:subtilase family serine protease